MLMFAEGAIFDMWPGRHARDANGIRKTSTPIDNGYRRQTAPVGRDKPCPYKVADIV